jgi:hypothetical protein
VSFPRCLHVVDDDVVPGGDLTPVVAKKAWRSTKLIAGPATGRHVE